MSDFQPQTTFYLLRNVKLDHSYTNTMDFDTKEEQYNYFFSKKAFEVKEGTYQRKTIGVVRVPFLYDDIATCNYIMWQNANYSDKWYYAFILEIKYINPNLSEIIYDLDVIQTYMFDIEWKPSQIERDMGAQFGSGNVPYVNREVEDLDYGSDYDIIFEKELEVLSNVSFVVVGCTLTTNDESTGQQIHGIPLGVKYYFFPISSRSKISETAYSIFQYNGQELTQAWKALKAFQSDTKLVNSVVSIKIYPFFPLELSGNEVSGSTYNITGYGVNVVTISTNEYGNIKAMAIQGQTNLLPYNIEATSNKYEAISYTENKAYMFPYTFGLLTNKRGQDFIIKLEDVSTINIIIKILGTVSNTPKFGYSVLGYNIDLPSTQEIDFDITQGIIESIENECPVIDDYTASYLQSSSNSIRVANANAKLIQQSALDRANNTFNTGQTIINNKKAQAEKNLALDVTRGVINATIQGAQTAANMGVSSKVMGLAVGVGVGAESLISSGQTYMNTQEAIRNTALIEANTLKNANISANTDYQVAIASTNAKVQDASCVPPTAKQLGGDYVFDIAHGCDKLYYQVKTIKPYYAKKMQDYWKRYGYKENTFRLPWRRKRKYWNYIKCVQANIFGNIPQSDLLKIRDIYMQGITIWHDEDVGNYNRVNEVTDSNI